MGKLMTLGFCRRFCKGYQYYGLQAANWCFCGNSYGKHGVVADGECAAKCPGNQNEICGNGGRNSIYREWCLKDVYIRLLEEATLGTFTFRPFS